MDWLGTHARRPMGNSSLLCAPLLLRTLCIQPERFTEALQWTCTGHSVFSPQMDTRLQADS